MTDDTDICHHTVWYLLHTVGGTCQLCKELLQKCFQLLHNSMKL